MSKVDLKKCFQFIILITTPVKGNISRADTANIVSSDRGNWVSIATNRHIYLVATTICGDNHTVLLVLPHVAAYAKCTAASSL